VSRHEYIVRVERSSACPMSVVDLGAATTKGVWSPRPCECSNGVRKSWVAGAGWDAVRKGASGGPTRRLWVLQWSAVMAGACRFNNSACLYVDGRLEIEDMTSN
jgi:hypothetical protein